MTAHGGHGRGAIAVSALLALAVALAPAPALAEGMQALYRCYNPASGEHLYTTHKEEVDHLVGVGWNWEEDQTRTLPSSSDRPVWRVYNPATQDHHYTSDAYEYKVLTTQQGWVADFSGDPAFYSAGKDGMPFYRMRTDPYVTFGHLYSADANEKSTLFSRGGWVDEGIGWYASRTDGSSDAAKPSNTTKPSASAFADNAGEWKVFGTCEWRVDGDTLYVRPQNAWDGEGTLGMYGDENQFPHYSNVKKVASSGTIHMATDSSDLFYNDGQLTDISAVAKWDASRVTNMQSVFYGCSSLTDISPLSSWNTSRVTNMQGMFHGCSSIYNLSSLAGWNTSRVNNMSSMFSGCTSLEDVSALRNWDTSSMSDMTWMFGSCASISDVSPLAGWDTSSVTDIQCMFTRCHALKDARALEGWDVSHVSIPGIQLPAVFDDTLPQDKRPSWARES